MERNEEIEEIIRAIKKIKYRKFLEDINPIKDILLREKISLEALFQEIEGEKLKRIEKEIREKMEVKEIERKRPKEKEKIIKVNWELIERFLEGIKKNKEKIDLISKKIEEVYREKGGRPPLYPVEGKINFLLLKEFLSVSSSECYEFLQNNPEIAKKIALEPLSGLVNLRKFIKKWKKEIFLEIKEIVNDIKEGKVSEEKKKILLPEDDEKIIKEINKRESTIQVMVKRIKRAPTFRSSRTHSLEAKIKALIFAKVKNINYTKLPEYLLERKDVFKELGFESYPSHSTFKRFLKSWGKYVEKDIEKISQSIKQKLQQDNKFKDRALEALSIIKGDKEIQRKIKEISEKIKIEKKRSGLPYYEILMAIVAQRVANPVIRGKEGEILQFLIQEKEIPPCVSLSRVENVKALLKELSLEKEIREIVSDVAIRIKKKEKEVVCPYCGKKAIVKYGKKIRKDGKVQIYFCKICKKRFTLFPKRKIEKKGEREISLDQEIKRKIWELFNGKERFLSPHEIFLIMKTKYQGKFDLTENEIGEFLSEEIRKRRNRRCGKCEAFKHYLKFKKDPNKKKYGWCEVKKTIRRKDQFICDKMI